VLHREHRVSGHGIVILSIELEELQHGTGVKYAEAAIFAADPDDCPTKSSGPLLAF